MAGPIKAVGTCPMCGMEFEIKAAVEASAPNEAAVVYSVTVTRQDVDAAVDHHMDKVCAESAGLMGRSSDG